MTNLLAVCLGSALGGGLRYGVTLACTSAYGVAFPVGTLVVNVVGSFLMGMVAAYFTRDGVAEVVAVPAGGWPWRLFLATGVLGGFTTFSAFTLDFVNLIERGDISRAATYCVLSLLLSVGGLFLGLVFMRMFTEIA